MVLRAGPMVSMAYIDRISGGCPVGQVLKSLLQDLCRLLSAHGRAAAWFLALQVQAGFRIRRACFGMNQGVCARVCLLKLQSACTSA